MVQRCFNILQGVISGLDLILRGSVFLNYESLLLKMHEEVSSFFDLRSNAGGSFGKNGGYLAK